jgi:NADH-quinone oxidoreductase subunit N
MNIPELGLAAFLPELLLGAAALVVLLVGAWSRDGRYAGWPGSVLVISALAAWWQGGVTESSFQGQYGGDGAGYFARGLLLLVALLITWLAAGGRALVRKRHAEFLSLLYISVLGMMVMASSQNLALIFLGLETMSIPLYVMAAFYRTDSASIEAGVKYFLYGAFASAFFVYGMALLFVSFGTSDLRLMMAATPDTVALAGLLLILVGLAFKVAAVPFHMWAPDAYAGAPTLVTSFFAIAPKAAGFLALYHWVVMAYHVAGPSETAALCSGLAWLTILGGNLGALVQTRLKRMLAYSSIAHAGYLLLALVAIGSGGTAALLFYLAAYGMMTLGSFVVLMVFEQDGPAGTYDEITGLAYQRPMLSLAMTVFMISLAGIPCTVGFMGKFQIFKSLLQGGQVALTILAVAGTLVSVAYYLRVVVYLYMRGESDRVPTSTPRIWSILAVTLAAATVVLGIFPGLLWPAVAAWAKATAAGSGLAGSF